MHRRASDQGAAACEAELRAVGLGGLFAAGSLTLPSVAVPPAAEPPCPCPASAAPVLARHGLIDARALMQRAMHGGDRPRRLPPSPIHRWPAQGDRPGGSVAGAALAGIAGNGTTHLDRREQSGT